MGPTSAPTSAGYYHKRVDEARGSPQAKREETSFRDKNFSSVSS